MDGAFRTYDAASWRTPRSGHSNDSGRFSASSPQAGIFGRYLRTNDGALHAVGELTDGILAQLEGEYQQRAKANAAGEKFCKLLRSELRKANVLSVKDLGEELVEGLRKQANFRV